MTYTRHKNRIENESMPRTRLYIIIAGFLVFGSLLTALGCGGSSSSTKQSVITSSGSNVLAISVNAGPVGNYANGAFASVTVCTPGTTTCQTVDGILIDTGSSGLRILSSALTTPLTQQQSAGNNPVVECLPFVSGYTWGPVQTADVELASEKASSIPVQVIDATAYPVPTSCSSFGVSESTLADLGANGILGVGVFSEDCGSACATTGPTNPGLYYECPAAGCAVLSEPLAQQVANPVNLFASDNNGVIIELPAATSPVATLTGSLVFGIGTQTNNALGSAKVYSVDGYGNFITSYQSQTYNESFIDSGSNGLYFLDSSITGIPVCSDAAFFYCPSSADNLSATTTGASGSPSNTVNFSIANADSMFNNNPTANVFPQLGGPNSLSGFDWGLPFFYGRNVFTAIYGKSTPSGTGPYWAY